jgi:AraC-like DNA-binding protein
MQAVGLGPKRYSRLVRAQKALGALRSGWPWPEVAHRCRYVDQAHLTHEIQAFAGRTPGGLIGAGRDTALMRSFNDHCLSSFFSTVYL